jgi:carbon storage regulator
LLVIRRRPGESLVIGDEVEIEILDASPSQVKLGIRAPRSVAVVRKEIHLTSRQNRVSARASARQLSPAAMSRLRESLKNPLLEPIRPL